MTKSNRRPSRRAAFAATLGLAAGTALLLPGCTKAVEKEADEGGVSATEDLMREHGVLRRILVVYRESAGLIRANAAALDAGALVQAADLFRRFGEDYHEKQLEEQYVFPAVRKAGGEGAGLIDALLRQHVRGREINAFVTDKCKIGRIAGGDAEPLARALESFARMYEIHAAIEDTVVFQAWKASMPRAELAELSEKFEDIEHQQFKGDGFDLAVDQVKAVEARLGLAGLDRYTAPLPGAAA
jgi:hemerythrin-like domain-containing protein